VIVGNSDGIGYALTRQQLDDRWTVTGLSRSTSDLRHDRFRHVVADVASAGYSPVLPVSWTR
jgi:NAD(P)-dependent dehydrogenase (short-subunit alcohol dehydrogenase family)